MNKADAALLQRYVDCFTRLDECVNDWVPAELADGVDEFGWEKWRPVPAETSADTLSDLYEELKLATGRTTRFPPLYEGLLLHYRWLEVDLGNYRLLANPPGGGLQGFRNELESLSDLGKVLLPNGYVQFAKGPGADFDPVCFDLQRHRRTRDCRIAKLDHEEILLHRRIREVAELAPNFRTLVTETIRGAEEKS